MLSIDYKNENVSKVAFAVIRLSNDKYVAVVASLDDKNKIIEKFHSEPGIASHAFMRWKDAIWLTLMDWAHRPLWHKDETLPRDFTALVMDLQTYGVDEYEFKKNQVISIKELAVNRQFARQEIAFYGQEKFKQLMERAA